MTVLDYSRSFVTFVTKPRQGDNTARIQIDACCHVSGWGPEKTYYLIAPCRSELMYRDGQLFQMPNYEFSGIFAEDELVLLRTHWTSDAEAPEYARVTDRFERVSIDPVRMDAEPLRAVGDIVSATLANRRMVARTTIRHDATGATAVLEYPIKTMNVTTAPEQFQVDTGPLIVPILDSAQEPAILRFEVAYGVYCSLDRAEFVLRRPHDVAGEGQPPISVTDYSALLFVAAEHELWGEAM
jgi:hypothetical protein